MPIDSIRILLPLLAAIFTERGFLLERHGRYVEAEQQYRAALEVLGPQESERRAAALTNLGECLVFSQKPAEAKLVLDRALEIFTSVRGAVDRRTAVTLSLLALLHRSTGDPARALPVARRAVSMLRQTVPSDSPSLIDAVNNLGGVYVDLRQYAEAEACFRSVRNPAVKNELQGHVLANLGAVESLTGNAAGAVRSYTEALPLLESAMGPSAPQLGPILNNLALAYYQLRRLDDAEYMVQRGLAVLDSAPPGLFRSQYLNLLRTLAGIERARGRKSAGRKLERQAHSVLVTK